MAVDIGSTFIKAAMGEIVHPGDLHILGIAQSESMGLRKGQIIDIEYAAKALESTLAQLERQTGVEIDNALMGFSGGDLYSMENQADVALKKSKLGITKEDKERVMQAVSQVNIEPDQSVVQAIIKQFAIDGFGGVREPIGMAGSRLEAGAALIVTSSLTVQNIYRLAEYVDLKIDALVYNPLLAAEAVLLPVEKDIGVVLLDIGGGTIDLSFFNQGSLSIASVIPMGDEYLIKDLSLVLRTSWKEAAIIKEKYGVDDSNKAKAESFLEVGNIQGSDIKQVSQKTIEEIISARLGEMVELVYAELRAFGINDRIPAGLVLTGGGASLSGIVELVKAHMDLPVRVGVPENMSQSTSDYFQPIYANVLGGLHYISKNFDVKQLDIKGVPKIWNDITYILKYLFR